MRNGSGGERLADSFVLGEWLVQPNLNRISRGSDTVQLRPKVMDVLVLLASMPGEVVTKDAIVDAVWAREFIADSALSRAVFELRAAFGDDPHSPQYIETIAKRGYRLVAPVAPSRPEPAAAGASMPATGRPKERWARLAGAIGLAVAAGLLVTLAPPGREPAGPPDSPKIVVLPFQTLGGSESGFFASGLTDEVTARLAGLRGLTVIAPDANRADRAVGADVTQFGRELGATHVLRGTVQWQRDAGGANRVRIMVQLVSTNEGWIAWADSFDRPASDALTVQQEVAGAVVEQLVNALGLDPGDAGAAPGSENVEAQRAYLRGVQHLWVSRGPGGGMKVGVQLLERAVELDPTFAEAHASLATAYARWYRQGFGTAPEHLERARESLRRAQALDPEAPEVRIASACVASCCDRAGDAGLAALRMISPAPHLTAAVAELETDILRRQGKWSESGVVLERAARLESGDAHVRRELAFNYSVLGLHGDALSCIDAAIAIAPDDLANYVEKSGCLRRSGRLAEAREALEAMPGAGGRDSERGWFCQEMAEGDFGGAVARARSLVREADAPTDPREHPALLLAQALSSAGEPAEARGRFEEVRAWAEERLRTVPDNSRLLQVQALSLAGLGKRAEAVAVARRAVEIAPPSLDAVEAALALESLTEVLVAVGDPEGAVDGLKMLLAAPSRLSLAILETDSKWGAVRLSPRIEELRRLALRPTP